MLLKMYLVIFCYQRSLYSPNIPTTEGPALTCSSHALPWPMAQFSFTNLHTPPCKSLLRCHHSVTWMLSFPCLNCAPFALASQYIKSVPCSSIRSQISREWELCSALYLWTLQKLKSGAQSMYTELKWGWRQLQGLTMAAMALSKCTCHLWLSNLFLEFL